MNKVVTSIHNVLIIQVQHFVVIDKNGKLASTTNTLSSFFGTGKYVKEGFI